jgi:hypothetical protein
MKISEMKLAALGAVLVALLWSPIGSAQPLPGGAPYVPPMAAEGVNLEVATSDAGVIVSVRITECDGCLPRTFLPRPDVELRAGEKLIGVRQALAASGGAGTVLYSAETELAEVVIFYGR